MQRNYQIPYTQDRKEVIIVKNLTKNTYETTDPCTAIVPASQRHLTADAFKEMLRYLLTGGATTAVNYIIYIALLHFNWNYLYANTIAWSFAVVFSYITNRALVFHSKNHVGREFFSFVSLRFLTLLSENLLLVLCIQLCQLPPLLSKPAVSVITVCANYIICKCRIFQKGASVNE